MNNHDTLQINVDPNIPLFRVTRTFAFPRNEIFRAHVDPQLVAQ
jgi:uncharacterized protein YndB with AHSA1/START domain